MKIKSTIAGVVAAASMLAVGASQAGVVCTKTTCAPWAVSDQFSGTGWTMVPCDTVLKPAATWQQYTSGSYAPPTTTTTRSILPLGL